MVMNGHPARDAREPNPQHRAGWARAHQHRDRGVLSQVASEHAGVVATVEDWVRHGVRRFSSHGGSGRELNSTELSRGVRLRLLALAASSHQLARARLGQ